MDITNIPMYNTALNMLAEYSLFKTLTVSEQEYVLRHLQHFTDNYSQRDINDIRCLKCDFRQLKDSTFEGMLKHEIDHILDNLKKSEKTIFAKVNY